MRIPDDFGEFERRVAASRGLEALRRNGVRLLLGFVILLLVLIGVFSSYYTVAPEGRAVIKRFGAVVGIVDPGLHFKLPFGIDQAWFVPTERVLKEEFGFRTQEVARPSRFAQSGQDTEEALMLTGDLNVINVEWVVQYLIRDPDKWLHQVRDQRDTIRDVSEAVMRRVVGNRLGSDVLTVGRVEIAATVKSEMQQILDSFEIGVQVSAVELQDVTPPDPVAPAFNEVNEARQQKERLVNLAEKERNQVVPRARGEASQVISEAEAYATERVNEAKGQTARFLALLEEYRKSEAVTRERLYLEMIDEVLPKIGSLFVVDEKTNSPLPLLDLRDAAGARGARKGGEER